MFVICLISYLGNYKRSRGAMIPKVIHYCWFGGNKKTKLIKKCIKSWKKYCPEYKIIEWNENNYNINQSCSYVREAYQEKKWAFVSDYVRLWVVYHYGGIYLDTDVELIKNIDCLLDHPAFFGFQDSKYIATGLGFGAEKGNSVIKCMLDDYLSCQFCLGKGEIDVTPCPVRNTRAIAHLLGTEIDTTTINSIQDAVLYPKEFFSPIDCKTLIMEKTENTISIHWFIGSWREKDFLILKEYDDFYHKVAKKLGKKTTYIFVTIYYWTFRHEKWKFLKEKWKAINE